MPTEDSRSAIAELRELRSAVTEDHPLRAAVAGVLGPQLALDALAVPETGADVLAEALDELALASRLDDTDIVLRHHHAVLLALRYMLHSGPDEDYETARAEFTALLDEPDYQELAGDLARLLLAQLRAASLQTAQDRRYSAELNEAAVIEFLSQARTLPTDTTTAAVEDIVRHLSQLSDQAKADDAVGSATALLATLATLTRSGVQDPAQALDEAIAQAEHGISRSGEGLDRALHAMLLAAARGEKARNTKDPADVAAARAAAKDTEELLRENVPLAPLLRTMITRINGPHDSIGPVDVPAELAAMREVLHRLDADSPARTDTITSFVLTMAIRIGRTGDRTGMDELREFVAQERSGIPDEGVRHLVTAMVDVLDSVLTEDPVQMSTGLAGLEAAGRLLSPQHRAYPLISSFMAMVLGMRAVSGRSLQDLDSARRLVDSLQPDLDGTHTKLSKLTVTLSGLRHGLSDVAQIDDAIEQLRGLTDEDRHTLGFDVDELVRDLGHLKQTALSFGKEDVPQTVLPEPPAEPGTASYPDFWPGRQGEIAAVAGLVHNGFLRGDLDMIDRGIAVLREQTTMNPRDRLRMLMLIGGAHMFRYMKSTQLTDLNHAIEQMEEARMLADLADPSDAGSVHFFLGDALHMRGNRRHDRADRARAAEHGILAMKARASEVLLQSSADHALTTAETATGEAEKVVQWCIVAERHDLAVHALELGRSLVLHSVSVESSIPDLLRDAGEAALAERWKNEATTENQRVVPSDLRFQVLNALAGTKVESQLLRPPSLDDIRTALQRTESQALVYLLPALSPVQPGFALVVPADGEVRHVPLPNLRSGPVQEFEAARRTLIDPSTADEELWEDAVAAMCDWSWRAVMGPLLDDLRGLPRLVLVPVGELGAVPWHAARRRIGAELRYACHDAIITYAASARQFVDAARRDRRPVDSAATLVRVQDPKLDWPQAEIAVLRDHCYPDATCVEGGVRPGEVLGHLPSELRAGASVLHLSCHACHATPAVDSHLALDDGEVLPVRDVLRQARNRPVDAEGGLVVLASCASDLTDSTQDEALTLATAFLAAGATGVVGARWPIVDVTTTLFVIMFHHYLTRGYEDPALALRATQLWMLDPRRRVPPDLPRKLARGARSFPIDRAGHWAAFTYQGR